MLTDKEKEVQEIIRSWKHTLHRINALKQEILEIQISITQNYSMTGGAGGGGKTSKVESFYLKKERKKAELDGLLKTVLSVRRILDSGVLTGTERLVIRRLLDGESLSRVAAANGIYISHIYKIKDSAIKKMAKLI